MFHEWNLRKDHQNYLTGQGNEHVSTEHTGQRRLQGTVGERRLQFAGHILRMAPECPAHCANRLDNSRWQKNVGQGRPGGQHFVTICMQEESAGARQRN